MNIKRITAVIIISVFFFIGSFFLFIRSRDRVTEEILQDKSLIEFNNQRFGHTLKYPESWQLRERDSLTYLHPSLASDQLPEIGVNWGTYKQVSRHVFIALSEFTHLDGASEHQIDYSIYPNNNNFSLTQWYDIFVLIESMNSQLITESQFFRHSVDVLDNNMRIAKGHNAYDPWTPEGELINAGNNEVLITQFPGDFRHDAYQYYIVAADNYIITISFGYRRGTASRTLWRRSNSAIMTVIENIKAI